MGIIFYAFSAFFNFYTSQTRHNRFLQKRSFLFSLPAIHSKRKSRPTLPDQDRVFFSPVCPFGTVLMQFLLLSAPCNCPYLSHFSCVLLTVPFEQTRWIRGCWQKYQNCHAPETGLARMVSVCFFWKCCSQCLMMNYWNVPCQAPYEWLSCVWLSASGLHLSTLRPRMARQQWPHSLDALVREHILCPHVLPVLQKNLLKKSTTLIKHFLFSIDRQLT